MDEVMDNAMDKPMQDPQKPADSEKPADPQKPADSLKPADPPASPQEPPQPLQLGDSSTEEFRRFQETRTQVMSTDNLLSVESDGLNLDSAPPEPSPPGRAHECLEIRTPIEEFETYVRARIDTLTRLGEQDRVDITVAALELGKRKLGRITGSPIA